MGVLSRWCQARGLSLLGLSPRNYQHYLADARETLAPATVRTRLFAHRSFFGHLVERGKRRKNPTANIMIRPERRLPPAPYSQHDLRALLLAACANSNPILADRNRALILMYIGTAARRNEMLGLMTADIDWRAELIYVNGKGGRRRALAPGRLALAALRQYLGDREGHVWLSRRGKPLDMSSAWKVLKVIARAAGVEGAYFHRFRHTYANDFLDESGDLLSLKTILGHQSYDMVERYVEYRATERALDTQRRLSLADRVAG